MEKMAISYAKYARYASGVAAPLGPLGVPGSVSSTNHEVFRKAYCAAQSQGILYFPSFMAILPLIRFSNHGAPPWLMIVLCYPYLLLELILKLLFEKIELTNVPDVDSRAKKKGFGVDGES